MKWTWGTSIAAAYVAFAIATSGFVVFAMHRPVPLVRSDYYAASLRVDERMAAQARARALGAAVSIERDGGDRIVVSIPPSQSATARGTVTLYRPSDVGADRTFVFSPDARGTQTLAVRGLARGHWVVKLQWSSAGQDYYTERPVALP